MIYLVIGLILIFDYFIIKISSKCARIEEKIENNKKV